MSERWAAKTQLSDLSFNGIVNPFTVVEAVFQILTFIILILLAIGTVVLVRSKKGTPAVEAPRTTLLAALLTFAVAKLLEFINTVLDLTHATVKNYYYIEIILQIFFELLGFCLTFYVLYELIHRFAHRVTSNAPRTLRVFAPLHWTLLGLMGALCVAEWALYIRGIDQQIESGGWRHRYAMIYYYVDAAQTVFMWVACLEMVAWGFVIAMKSNTRLGAPAPTQTLRVPASGLAFACLSFAAMNFMWAFDAVALAENKYIQALVLAKAVVALPTSVGTYGGVLLCCYKWRRETDLGEEKGAGGYGKQQRLVEADSRAMRPEMGVFGEVVEADGRGRSELLMPE